MTTADFRTDVTTPVTPANAAAAIIVVDGQYLLQLRDNKRGVFFPGHWGCFGGGLDPGETAEAAIHRELKEELGLALPPARFTSFSRFDFSLDFAGLAPIYRQFFEIALDRDELTRLSLGEGSDMKLFPAEDILTGAIPITPYDAFALWFHINRARLRG